MIGNYKNKLDNKGRVMIPIKFRTSFEKNVILSLGFDHILEVRDPDSFDTWIKFLEQNSSLNKDTRIVLRTLLGNSFKLKIDRQGRINIPKSLIISSLLREEVVFVGVNNKIEIHALEGWVEFMKISAEGILEQAAANLDKKN